MLGARLMKKRTAIPGLQEALLFGWRRLPATSPVWQYKRNMYSFQERL
jgi:hypothetical protein